MSARWLTVRNEAEKAEITIAGPIGSSWWDDTGTSAKEFCDALKEIPRGRKVTVSINSEGGSIKDGLGIYNAIKDRREDVTCRVDGYALSIASIIALGGGRVISPKSSIWMIHEPWSYTQGNAEEHLRSAEMLDKHGDMLAAVYAEETGRPKAEMREAMKKESWFTGEEATEYGLADETPCEECDPVAARSVALNVAGKECRIPERILAARMGGAAGAKTDPTYTPPRADTPAQGQQPLTAPASISANAQSADQPVGAAADTNTKREEPNRMAENTVAAANPSAEIAALKAQADAMSALLEKEKRNRVTAEINRRAANKIKNDKLGFWIDQAMKGDENAIYDQIDALTTASAGGDPVGHSSVSVADTEMQRVMKMPTASERYNAWRAADWSALIADAAARGKRGETMNLPTNPYGFEQQRGMPVNANTYSATLVTSYLLDGATTILQPKLTALMAFTREFSQDPYKPKATHVHKYVDGTSSTVEDCTDWEPALGDTVDPISVTMHQETQIFGVSNSDLNSGLRMEDITRINTMAIAKTITEKAMGPITVANFGTVAGTTGAGAPLVCAADGFGYNELTTLRAYIKNAMTKNIILDGSYFARITNVPTFYQQAAVTPGGGFRIFGWDFIGEVNDWTGAAANVQGFACDPQAILVVAGIPLTPPSVPGNTLQEGRLTVPDVGLTIGAYTWFSLQYRTLRTSFDLMFGAAAMDKTAGTLLKSA